MGLHSAAERRQILREIRARRGGAEQTVVRRLQLLETTPDTVLGHAAQVPAVRALRDGHAPVARPARRAPYVLDEPEAALSPQNVLTLLQRIHQLVSDGSQ